MAVCIVIAVWAFFPPICLRIRGRHSWFSGSLRVELSGFTRLFFHSWSYNQCISCCVSGLCSQVSSDWIFFLTSLLHFNLVKIKCCGSMGVQYSLEHMFWPKVDLHICSFKDTDYNQEVQISVARWSQSFSFRFSPARLFSPYLVLWSFCFWEQTAAWYDYTRHNWLNLKAPSSLFSSVRTRRAVKRSHVVCKIEKKGNIQVIGLSRSQHWLMLTTHLSAALTSCE